MLTPKVAILSSQPRANANYDGTNDHTEDNGNRQYELTNHLGNVLVTITDKNLPFTATGGAVAFNADIVSAQDYYPFGMQMPGRTYIATTAAGSNYRYGFNGQENVNEIAGVGNHTTAQFWEYDPRIGRRWNLDPSPTVGVSEYSVFRNNPIWFGDLLGDSSRPGFFGGVADFAEGGWGAVKSDAKGLWSFATSDAWKGKTWSELGKNTVALTIGVNSNGAAIGVLSDIDEKVGTDLLARYSSMAVKTGEAIKNIPNMNAKDWGSFTGHVAFAVASTKGLNLAGEGLQTLNEFAATKYLSATGDLGAFDKVQGFSLRLGSNDFAYHSSLERATASRWSTPTSFSSSGNAFKSLALDYPKTTNFAQLKFGVKDWGIFVKGTAAPHGSTLGQGTQLLRTPFTLKASVRQVPF
jgi:hypothetical protein